MIWRLLTVSYFVGMACLGSYLVGAVHDCSMALDVWCWGDIFWGSIMGVVIFNAILFGMLVSIVWVIWGGEPFQKK